MASQHGTWILTRPIFPQYVFTHAHTHSTKTNLNFKIEAKPVPTSQAFTLFWAINLLLTNCRLDVNTHGTLQNETNVELVPIVCMWDAWTGCAAANNRLCRRINVDVKPLVTAATTTLNLGWINFIGLSTTSIEHDVTFADNASRKKMLARDAH